MSTTTAPNGASQPTDHLPTHQGPNPAAERRKSTQPEPEIPAPDASPRPADLDALVRLRDHAQQVVEVQDDPAILGAKTDDDLAAEHEQRQRHRADLRAADDAEHQDKLSRRDQRRRRQSSREAAREQHEDQLAASSEERERQQARAESERDRLLDPTDQLRRAVHQRTWVPRVLLVPSIAAGVTSVVNLATQGTRVVDPAPAGLALGLGADAVFTTAMAGLLLARMVGADQLATSVSGRTRLGWFTLGDLTAGAALAALSVVAHRLPSADGAPHNASAGWLFLGLVGGFAFSSIFAPMARRLLDEKVRAAATAVRQSRLVSRLEAPAEKLSDAVAADVRTAKLMLDIDARDGLGGMRGEDGLPSGTKVYEAMRQHLGHGNYASAGRIRALMAEMSASHYPTQ